MAKFRIAFAIDKARLGDLIEVLQPFKIEDFEMKLVAGTATKVRAGDKPAWQIVAEMATDRAQPRTAFAAALREAGFKSAGTGIDQAVRNRAVRKVSVKGRPHLVRAKNGGAK